MLQVALLLGGGVLGGAGLVLLVPIVHSIGDPGAALRLPLVGETGLGVVPLWALLAMFVLLTALQALVTRTSTVNGARLQQGIADDLRHEAFVALLAAQWTFVIERRRSDIMQVITTGSARSASAVGFLMQGAVAAVLATVTAIAAVAVDPLVGVLAAGSVVVLGLVQGEGIRPAFRLGRLFGERNRHLQAVVLDSLDSLRLVRAHDAAAGWAERLADAFTGARRAQLATTERMSAVSAVSSVALAGSAAALVLTATWASVPPPEIAVMLLLTARLSSHTQAITRSATLLAEALPAVGDLTQLTVDARGRAELPVGTKPATRGPIPGNCVALVEFRAVTFHHGDTTNGVTDLDLVVPTGAITVLTGPSGSGKSTTADLVLGLLVAQTGAVCVAGAPLRAEELAWWRSHVAYVPQETVLVPGTLRENLLWSAVEAVDDDACWRALDQAAAGFARGLADGLDTVVGDRGIRLSGGERQRVAIARALLRRPALLVLDEATASLDDDTEAAVLGTLRALTPATTVLAIAHRRSTIDAADHVVRLQAGRRIGAG